MIPIVAFHPSNAVAVSRAGALLPDPPSTHSVRAIRASCSALLRGGFVVLGMYHTLLGTFVTNPMAPMYQGRVVASCANVDAVRHARQLKESTISVSRATCRVKRAPCAV